MGSDLKTILESKLVSMFYVNSSADISQHLSRYTLQFKVKDLEKHYSRFLEKSQQLPSTVLGVVVMVVSLCYIGIDTLYKKFFELMISRIVTSGAVGLMLALALILAYFGIHMLSWIGTITDAFLVVLSMYSLVLRDDTSCSPLLLILLWTNMYSVAPKFPQRTILGILVIITHAFVWLYRLHFNQDTVSFLNQQTLNYSLFFFGVIISAYSRELMHRKVYLQTHAIISSVPGLIKRLPLSPSKISRKSARKSIVVSLDDAQVFSSRDFGSTADEVVHHRAIQKFIRSISNKWTLRFRDKEKEDKFSEWQLQESLHSLRRLLALNIISFAFCVTHDFDFPNLTRQHRMDLLAMRFGIILPCFIVCFALSLWSRVALSFWRRRFVLILEVIVVVTSIVTSVFLYQILLEPGCTSDSCTSTRAWNLYFGSAERLLIYGYTGMGLLWIQSFATTLVIMIFVYALNLPFGVYALTPLMLVVAGCGIAYVDERARRTEFFVSFFASEVVDHLASEFSGDGTQRSVMISESLENGEILEMSERSSGSELTDSVGLEKSTGELLP